MDNENNIEQLAQTLVDNYRTLKDPPVLEHWLHAITDKAIKSYFASGRPTPAKTGAAVGA